MFRVQGLVFKDWGSLLPGEKRAHQESGDPKVGQNGKLRRSRQECALVPANESLTELYAGRQRSTELLTATTAMHNSKKGAVSCVNARAREDQSTRVRA